MGTINKPPFDWKEFVKKPTGLIPIRIIEHGINRYVRVSSSSSSRCRVGTHRCVQKGDHYYRYIDGMGGSGYFYDNAYLYRSILYEDHFVLIRIHYIAMVPTIVATPMGLTIMTRVPGSSCTELRGLTVFCMFCLADEKLCKFHDFRTDS